MFFFFFFISMDLTKSFRSIVLLLTNGDETAGLAQDLCSSQIEMVVKEMRSPYPSALKDPFPWDIGLVLFSADMISFVCSNLSSPPRTKKIHGCSLVQTFLCFIGSNEFLLIVLLPCGLMKCILSPENRLWKLV